MAKQVNYGIIGCGMMGQEHLQNIALLPNTRVHAIFEPDPQMAAKAKALAPEAILSPSLEALLSEDVLDCLVIASPNFRHMEQLEAIAATRSLPILVEKPLFTSPEDIARLKAFETTYKAPVWVAMEYRYMPPIAALIDQAHRVTGDIKMLTLREHRFPFLEKVGDWNRFNANTGGTFVEKCCHFFDLMCLALQSTPVQVMASGGIASNHLQERYEGRTPDILDHGYVIVDFESGARAMLELCMFAEGSKYQEVISAVGPDGKIESFVPGPQRFWPEHLGAPPTAKLVISPRHEPGEVETQIDVDPALLAAGDHNGATYYQHKKFLDLVLGDSQKPEVGLAEGRIAVIMGLAAQRSIETGNAVKITEFD